MSLRRVICIVLPVALLNVASGVAKANASPAHAASKSDPPLLLQRAPASTKPRRSVNCVVQPIGFIGQPMTSLTLPETKKTYEVTVRSGDELDQAAYKIYRSLSVGSQKTSIAYAGKEGLRRLPDAKGGMNGGFIGFRRVAETSGRKSPAIDLNTPELGDLKIHFVK
jgi:hypothetical protein